MDESSEHITMPAIDRARRKAAAKKAAEDERVRAAIERAQKEMAAKKAAEDERVRAAIERAQKEMAAKIAAEKEQVAASIERAQKEKASETEKFMASIERAQKEKASEMEKFRASIERAQKEKASEMEKFRASIEEAQKEKAAKDAAEMEKFRASIERAQREKAVKDAAETEKFRASIKKAQKEKAVALPDLSQVDEAIASVERDTAPNLVLPAQLPAMSAQVNQPMVEDANATTEHDGTVMMPGVVEASPPQEEQAEAETSEDRNGDHILVFHPRREASKAQLCLNAHTYAKVIASTVSKAADEDDFVFALYGPWGRGKTTLIKELISQLQDPGTKQKAGGKEYEVVDFKAWKYPSRPEVWIHLYQRIAETIEGGDAWQKWRIRLRLGLLQKGWWPLWLGFGALVLTGFWATLAVQMSLVIGILGLWVIGSFGWNAWQLKNKLLHTYGSRPDHSEKLGLQAVIGDDLKRLLKCCIGEDREVSRWRLHVVTGLASLALSSLCWRFCTQNTGSLWWGVLIGVFCLAGAIVFYRLAETLRTQPRKFDKVLLVVDDLDRCEPDQMLAVIESIRLFVDEPKMSSRLQVLMLMDKAILECALKTRWAAGFGKEEGAALKLDLLAMREKYFVVELSLPLLSLKEISDIAAGIVDGTLRTQVEVIVQEVLPASSTPALPSEPLPKKAPVQVDFTEAERKKLKLVIETRFGGPNHLMIHAPAEARAKLVTPRAIRAFVMRYQMARLLLLETGKSFDSDLLADALAYRLVEGKMLEDVKPSSSNEVIWWAIHHVV